MGAVEVKTSGGSSSKKNRPGTPVRMPMIVGECSRCETKLFRKPLEELFTCRACGTLDPPLIYAEMLDFKP